MKLKKCSSCGRTIIVATYEEENESRTLLCNDCQRQKYNEEKYLNELEWENGKIIEELEKSEDNND